MATTRGLVHQIKWNPSVHAIFAWIGPTPRNAQVLSLQLRDGETSADGVAKRNLARCLVNALQRGTQIAVVHDDAGAEILSVSTGPLARLGLAAFDGTTYWSPQVPSAATAVRIVVLDQSFSKSPFTQKTADWIDQLRAAGQLVFGYVPCNEGATAPAVLAQSVTAWHERYPQIDGIYIDQGPTDDGTKVQPNGQTTTQNYAAYQADITSRTAVEGGAPRRWRTMIEAAQYPFDWVLSVAEFVLLWEGDASIYDTGYRAYLPSWPLTQPPPAWWSQPEQQQRIVHTISGYQPGAAQNPPDMKQITDVLAKAYRRGAGTVYLTDAFGRIPAYWAQEVGAFQ